MFYQWLISMHISAVMTCGALFVPEDPCIPYVLECLMDGESEQWCLESYVYGDK